MTLADILDGMFRLFLAHWRTYALALGLVVVPQSFVMALLAGEVGMGTGLLEQFNNPAAAEAMFEAGPQMWAVISLVAVSVVVGIFVTPYLTGVACRIAGEAFEGGDPQPGDVLRSTLQRYWALLAVIMLQVLIFLGIFAVPIGLIAAGAIGGNDGLAVGGGILMLFLFPLAIWLLIRLTLAVPVVVMERVGPATALRRSYSLVQGRWWRVCGTFLLAQFITAIVAQIASFPFSLPGQLFGGLFAVVFIGLGTVVAAVITTPLSANAQTLLYYDGRIRSEGYDLEVMARNQFEPPPPTGPAVG